MRSLNFVLLFSLLGILSCAQYKVLKDNSILKSNSFEKTESPYVVMISLDGFRHDYLKKYKPPFLSSIVRKGIQAKSLTPTFPSKTFPNHYSLVTGMYAGNHGLVANRFYDPEWKEDYQLGGESVQNGKWYGGTPLWLAVQDQGLMSASFFWVGSDANIKKRHPNYYVNYQHSLKNELRTERIVKWLSLPKEVRPHYLTLYFSDVDSQGHRHGPDSPQVKEAVLKVDKLISDMVARINELPIEVNYIVVSDHGMMAIENNKKVYLKDYVDTALAKFHERGPLTMIYLKDKKNIGAYKKALKKVPFTKIYSRKNLPKKFHLSHNERAGDLILLAEPGAYIYPNKNPPKEKKTSGISGGTHGYDPYLSKEMGGIFLSYGPRVKAKGLIKTIDNVHVFPYVMDLLGLDQLKGIDGKRSVLAPYIKRTH